MIVGLQGETKTDMFILMQKAFQKESEKLLIMFIPRDYYLEFILIVELKLGTKIGDIVWKLIYWILESAGRPGSYGYEKM